MIIAEFTDSPFRAALCASAGLNSEGKTIEVNEGKAPEKRRSWCQIGVRLTVDVGALVQKMCRS